VLLSPIQWINLGSVIFGAAGTVVLFKGGFSYEAPSAYMNPQLVDDMRRRNQRRWWLQHIGLALILTSIALQGVALFVS
jgi:hypothetical protein